MIFQIHFSEYDLPHQKACKKLYIVLNYINNIVSLYILSGFHVFLPGIELRDVYICSKRYFWQFTVKLISRVSSEIAVFNVYKQIVKKTLNFERSTLIFQMAPYVRLISTSRTIILPNTIILPQVHNLTLISHISAQLLVLVFYKL